MVFSACQTSDSALWFATGDGYGLGNIILKKGNTTKIFSVDDGLPEATYQKIVVASDGSIWAGGFSPQASNTIVVANYRLSKWRAWSVKNFSALPMVNKLCELPSGEMWIATFNGILEQSDTTFKYIGTEEGLPDIRINDVLVDKHHRVWVATESGIFQFLDGHFIGFDDTNVIPSATVLCEDSRSFIWAGSKFGNEGISVFDGFRWHTYTMNDGLVDNCVGTIIEDYLNRMWFGGYFDSQSGGVTLLSNGQFQNYEFPLLGKYSVDCMFADRSGGIWFGGSLKEKSRLGLSYYRLGKWHRFGQKDGLSNDRVFFIFEDYEGQIWVSTINGLFVGSLSIIIKTLEQH
jgi:Two component regulator propeller.